MFTDMSSSSVVKLVADQVLQIFLDFSPLCSSSNLTCLPFTHCAWHIQVNLSHDKISCPQYSLFCELFSLCVLFVCFLMFAKILMFFALF